MTYSKLPQNEYQFREFTSGKENNLTWKRWGCTADYVMQRLVNHLQKIQTLKWKCQNQYFFGQTFALLFLVVHWFSCNTLEEKYKTTLKLNWSLLSWRKILPENLKLLNGISSSILMQNIWIDKCEKCQTLFVFLQVKCKRRKKYLELTDFKGSLDWISSALRRHNIERINLHREANSMTARECERFMAPWRQDLEDLCDNEISSSFCLYNTDQTGLFYQKVPNSLYVNKSENN